jgi:hypothetical protein
MTALKTIPARMLIPLLAGLCFSLAATAEEVTPTPPSARFTSSLGFEYVKDSSIAGQESSQTSIPLMFSRSTESLVFEITLPYIKRTAPTGKVAHSHHHESKSDSTVISPLVTNEGMGDVVTSLQFSLLNGADAAFSLHTKLEAKFGTADVKQGLGTGANDYSIELIANHAHGDYAVSGSAGYAKLGSPGEVKINDVKKTINLNDIYFGSVSATYQVMPAWNVGAKLELGQAAETGGPQQRDLSATTEYLLASGNSFKLQILKSVTPGLAIRGLSASFLMPF